MADIRSTIELDIGDAKRDLEEIQENMDSIHEALFELGSASSFTQDQFKEMAAGARDAAGDIQMEFSSASEGIMSRIDDITNRWTGMVDEMRSRRGVSGVLGETLPRQLGGVQDSFKSFKSSLLSELPFGGLIGLMVMGGKRQEEIRAMSTDAARIFQQTSDVGRKHIGEIAGDVRGLANMLGLKPGALAGEFKAAGAAFAQAGVDIEDVMEKSLIVPGKAASESILTTSIRIDALFKQASGTAAKDMGALIKDFNMNAREAARVVTSIGMAARDSGTSVSAFMSSVMRSSQALRTQRVDITEVAEAQLKFQKILEEQGLGKQFAAGYAERGVQQISQGISGLGVGMSAVLGERMGQGQGLDACYAFREGMGGAGQGTQDKGLFTQTIQEMVSLAKEQAPGDESGQRFMLEQLMPGLGAEGSKAMLAVADKLEGGMDIDKAMQESGQALKDAFVDRAAETSAFQRSMLKMQDGLAKIGAGILAAIIEGFKMIYALGKAIANYRVTGETSEFKVAMRMLDQSSKRSTRATDMVLKGLNQMGAGAKLGLNTLLGGGQSEEQIRMGVLKESGQTASVGGVMMSPEDASSTRSRAKREFQSRAEEDLALSLKAAGLQGQVIGGGGGGTLLGGGPGTGVGGAGRVMAAYKAKGAGAAEEEIRKLQQAGRGKHLRPGMVKEAEMAAGRAKFDVAGREVQLRVIVERSDKKSAKPAEGP